ncbi:MAG: hypothetical protein Q7S40_19045 [Opitutaceae bacterium]|nr:hypothetical protein [Opitutaceae bacterium]
MSPAPTAQPRKLPFAKLVVVCLVLLVVLVLVLRGVDLRGFGDRVVAVIRNAGPWAFFSAMMVLPAFGVPMMAFTIPAGEAFSAQLGMPGVIAIALFAIAVNLALGYWVARYALRPVVVVVLKRFGYSVPRITPGNALSVLLIVRLTPGPPYFLQACILGVAQAPFRLYLIVSWLAILPWAIGGIILGKGLFAGNFAAVLLGLGLLVAAGVGLQWVRRKYARREENDSPEI